MLTFTCTNCKFNFEAEGNKIEYQSPIYGPCFKYIANCPKCNEQCNEFRSPVPKKEAKYSPTGHSCNGCCCHK